MIVTDPLAQLRKAAGIVRLHGHRGARGIWPENTAMGFRNTFDLGLQVVELDVLLTKDNVAVVTHNPRLMADTTRGPDGQWLPAEGPKICDLTFADLCTYDVGGMRPGSAYAARYPEQAFLYGQHIPTLDEVARLIQKPPYSDAWLNIEIKSTPTQNGLTPAPALLTFQVAQVIAQNHLSKRVIVQSFDWRVLEHIAQIAPHLPRSHLTYLTRPDPAFEPNIYPGSPWMAGAVTSRGDDNLCEVIAEAGGQIWAPFHEDITSDQVARAQAMGLIVNAWTVNEPADIDRMIDAGVDGIITDYPGRAQRCLIEKGLNWREDFAERDRAG